MYDSIPCLSPTLITDLHSQAINLSYIDRQKTKLSLRQGERRWRRGRRQAPPKRQSFATRQLIINIETTKLCYPPSFCDATIRKVVIHYNSSMQHCCEACSTFAICELEHLWSKVSEGTQAWNYVAWETELFSCNIFRIIISHDYNRSMSRSLTFSRSRSRRFAMASRSSSQFYGSKANKAWHPSVVSAADAASSLPGWYWIGL